MSRFILKLVIIAENINEFRACFVVFPKFIKSTSELDELQDVSDEVIKEAIKLTLKGVAYRIEATQLKIKIELDQTHINALVDGLSYEVVRRASFRV